MTNGLSTLRRNLGATLVGAISLVVGLWLVFIRTEWGQRLDDAAVRGRWVVDFDVLKAHGRSLGVITVASMVGGCIALVVVGAVRGRPLLGVAAALLVGCAGVTTELLKVLIDRPVFPAVDWHPENTFPSGHATASASLAFAFIMVTPHRWRAATAIAGGLWVAFQGTGVVAAGWHRPSEAVAGFAVAIAWASFAVMVMVAIGRVRPANQEAESPERLTAAVLVVLAIMLVGLVAGTMLGGDSPYTFKGGAFLVSTASIDVVAVGLIWWFERMLNSWTLGLTPATGE